MHIRFVAVPSDMLPKDQTAALMTSDTEALYIVNRDEPAERICAALTRLTNEFAQQEWMHVGPPAAQRDLENAG